MRLKDTFIALSLIAALSACRAAQDKNWPTNQPAHSTIAKGDTVSEMSNSLWYVFQARNNDYWFGSNGEGVYRYDGKTITHFTTKDGLFANRIRGIQEDKAGNIYFTTTEQVFTPLAVQPTHPGGISKFDGKTFSTLIPTESNTAENVWRLQPDDLWFAGPQDSGVVYRYDGKSLHRLKFPKTKAGEEHIAKYPRSKFPNMTYSPYDVYAIYKDSKGNIWFGTNLGVCRYDGNSFAWVSEDELDFDDQGSAFNVRSIIEDRDGKFWFTDLSP
jgi:hypothetical protein